MSYKEENKQVGVILKVFPFFYCDFSNFLLLLLVFVAGINHTDFVNALFFPFRLQYSTSWSTMGEVMIFFLHTLLPPKRDIFLDMATWFQSTMNYHSGKKLPWRVIRPAKNMAQLLPHPQAPVGTDGKAGKQGARGLMVRDRASGPQRQANRVRQSHNTKRTVHYQGGGRLGTTQVQLRVLI